MGYRIMLGEEEFFVEVSTLNQLADETSPYLLDHADNPVNWFPWGEEAFEKARREDRPIFLSVGYSACHWCHVMKRESFKDPEIAEILNEHFVPIKVDREERPDVDEIYMQAVQAMTGRGGWPMSVFLTPDLEPFYGGTYFPPESRQGMPSFRTILERIKETYNENREEVEKSANKLSSSLQRLAGTPSDQDVPGPDVFTSVYESLSNQFDQRWGGFGDAPKFPRPMDLQLLFRLGNHNRFDQAVEMARKTLDGLMYGGIYDQVGGGFSRYSTDSKWLVPHFEKMLYDNAQLVDTFLTGFQIFEDPRYRLIVRQTLEYIDREMTHPDGAFYSTQNAESEGEEGKYYVWNYEEFIEVVEEAPEAVAEFFGVSKQGNFEGKNILHVPTPLEEFCDKTDRDPTEFQEILWSAVNKLREHREQRVKPERDEKILTDWNGLMISAYARAGFILDKPDYGDCAESALDFLLDQSVQNGIIHHVHKEGETHTPGFLDDYAFLIKALLEVFQYTGEPERLEQAQYYFDQAVDRFWDDENGGFTFTDDHHSDLLVRSKNPQDKAQPSGNSEMVINALKLSALSADPSYREYASKSLATFSSLIGKRSSGLTRMICGLYDYHVGSAEAVAIGTEEEINLMLESFRRQYVPAHVRFPAHKNLRDAIPEHPLLSGRLDGPSPSVYLCQQGTCRRPARDSEELGDQVEDLMESRKERL